MRRLTPLIVCLLALAGCGSSHPSATGPVHPSATGPSRPSATGSAHPPGWGATPKGVALPRPERFGAAPTRTMFDTTDCTLTACSVIPPHPFAVAGYTAGHWVTYGPLRHVFRLAHAISIAVAARFHAACLDDEPGDATPAQAGPWALADIQAGFAVPCVYGDLSNMPAIKASLRAWLGSGWRARVLLWLAWYRFVPGLVAGYDAVQYDDHCLRRNLDCSTVSLGFLRVAQPPYVASKPKPKPPSFDQLFNQGFQRGYTVHWDRSQHRPVPPTRLVFGRVVQLGYDAGWRAA